MWQLLKLDFLLAIRFPPLLRRLMVSDNELSDKIYDFNLFNSEAELFLPNMLHAMSNNMLHVIWTQFRPNQVKLTTTTTTTNPQIASFGIINITIDQFELSLRGNRNSHSSRCNTSSGSASSVSG